MNKEINYVKEFYTLDQLSQELNFNVRILRDYVNKGKLKASKIGTRYIVTRDNIKEWLKENEKK